MKIYIYNGKKVYFKTSTYRSNGTLAVMLFDAETKAPFATLTKNIDPYSGLHLQSASRAFLDTNNCPGLIDFLHECGVARYAGRLVPCGHWTYPLFEFNVCKLRR